LGLTEEGGFHVPRCHPYDPAKFHWSNMRAPLADAQGLDFQAGAMRCVSIRINIARVLLATGGRLCEGSNMRPGPQSDRHARIETEARRLARSGVHYNHNSVRAVLLSQGFSESHKVFANRWTCSELDRICEQTFVNKTMAA
jgi:hypothetical protein